VSALACHPCKRDAGHRLQHHGGRREDHIGQHNLAAHRRNDLGLSRACSHFVSSSQVMDRPSRGSRYSTGRIPLRSPGARACPCRPLRRWESIAAGQLGGENDRRHAGDFRPVVAIGNQLPRAAQRPTLMGSSNDPDRHPPVWLPNQLSQVPIRSNDAPQWGICIGNPIRRQAPIIHNP